MEELIFEDGQLPSQNVIDRWIKIVDDFFDDASQKDSAAKKSVLEENKDGQAAAAEANLLKRKRAP